MNTALVFVANIPFYVYYNSHPDFNASPRYRTLAVCDKGDAIALRCFDSLGQEIAPYPEYVLALLTYMLEVKGRYKRCWKINTQQGVHAYDFYVDSAHNYGICADLCKQILTFEVKMPDYTLLRVADYKGYDTVRLVYVKNLDCFDAGVLRQLRLLGTLGNSDRALAFSYMRSLRFVCEPICDLTAEIMISIALFLNAERRCNLEMPLRFDSSWVRFTKDLPTYFARCEIGDLNNGNDKK